MTTATERLELIQANYTNALINEPLDLAAARTAADVSVIHNNIATARTVYFSAIARTLAESGSDVEAAYISAKKAVEAVETARAKTEKLAMILDKVSNATKAATQLLEKASGLIT